MTTLGLRIAEARKSIGLSQDQLAQATGYEQTSIAEIEAGNVAAPRRWREIADVLGIPHEEIRALMLAAGEGKQRRSRVAREGNLPASIREFVRANAPNAKVGGPAPSLSAKRVPVLGMAVGGALGEYIFNGQAIDYVLCPPGLENVAGAYACFVDGDSMYPRYRAGETVWVHPNRPARRGDDVVVQIFADEDEPPHGYIKEMVGWSGNKLKLRQHNPPQEIIFERDRVVSVHPIVFSQKV